MHKVISFLAITVLSLVSYGQSQPAALLQKGVDAFNDNKFDSAVYYWNQIVSNFKDSTWYYGRALNNIPVAYEAAGNTAKAATAYHTILTSDLNDREKNEDNLMEPYSNYRHNACMRMARMYIDVQGYANALEALRWAESKYTYQTFSGTSYEKRLVSIASWRSGIYTDMNKPDSAIYALVFKVLDNDVSVHLPDMSSFTNVDFYSKITEEVVPLIEEQYTKAAFKAALEKSIDGMQLSKEGEITYATIQLFGLSYKLPSDAKDASKETFTIRIKSSTLYNKL